MSLIANLDFGKDSAESESESLHNVFLSIPFYERLKNMEKWLVLGRKGSGKTAACLMFFYQLRNEHKVTLLTPRSLSAAKSLFLDQSGINSEEIAIQKWKYVYCLEISRYIVQQAEEEWGPYHAEWPDVLQEIRSFLISQDGTQQSQLDKALKYVRGVKKFSVKVLGVEGGIELDNTPSNLRSLEESLDNFLSLVRSSYQHLNEKELFFLIDQVDDLWDSSKQGKALVVGLLRATKEVNDSLDYVNAIVFLRSDIFEYLRFHDSDKYRSITEVITWDTQNLKKLATIRIKESTSCNGDENDLWNLVFPTQINGEDSFQYMVSHTLMRPRDLIQLCNVCRDKARDARHERISEGDIQSAIRQYSKWKIDDLVSEYAIQYPFLEQLLLNVFYYLPYYRLEQKQFKANFKDKKEGFIKEYGNVFFDPDELVLQILYSVGFLGVELNGKVLYEALGDKLVLPDAALLQIHPAFRSGLNILNVKFPSSNTSNNDNSKFNQVNQRVVGNVNVGGFIRGDIITGDRNTINIIRSQHSVEMEELADELSMLRAAMRTKSEDPDHDIATSYVARAEVAARLKELSTVMECLGLAGQWALDVASEIGAKLAIDAIKKGINR